MDRKKFITTSALAAISISACGNIRKTTVDSFESECTTTNDILGPFYRPHAPKKQDLTDSDLIGSRVNLKGIVYGPDCNTPLKNALVEIWHCNTEGDYDNTSKEFKQRGSWITNENGEYSFKTILPGKYLNGKLYRPAHIHFRVTEKNSKELVSQVYFKNDPDITKDPWASNPKADLRILPLTLEDTKGNLSVNFDIYLSKKI